MNPLIVLVAGLLLLYIGITGRAESIWIALAKGGGGSASPPKGKARPRR